MPVTPWAFYFIVSRVVLSLFPFTRLPYVSCPFLGSLCFVSAPTSPQPTPFAPTPPVCRLIPLHLLCALSRSRRSERDATMALKEALAKKGGLTLSQLASYDDLITDALVDRVSQSQALVFYQVCHVLREQRY